MKLEHPNGNILIYARYHLRNVDDQNIHQVIYFSYKYDC